MKLSNMKILYESYIEDLYKDKNTNKHKFLKFFLAHQDIDEIANSLPDISYAFPIVALNEIVKNTVDELDIVKTPKSHRIKNILTVNSNQYNFLKNIDNITHYTHDIQSEIRTMHVNVNNDIENLKLDFRTRCFNIYNRIEERKCEPPIVPIVYDYIFDIFQSVVIHNTIKYMIDSGYSCLFNKVQMITNRSRIVPSVYDKLNINVLDVVGDDFKKSSSIFSNTFYPFGGELIEPYMANISVVCETFRIQENYMKKFGKNVIYCPFLYYSPATHQVEREYIMNDGSLIGDPDILDKKIYKFYENKSIKSIIFHTAKTLNFLENRLISEDYDLIR